MVHLDMPNDNTVKILEQSKFIRRSYRRFQLEFYVLLIHKTRKKYEAFYIFGHNFCYKQYFLMKIARLVYRSRIQMS